VANESIGPFRPAIWPKLLEMLFLIGLGQGYVSPGGEGFWAGKTRTCIFCMGLSLHSATWKTTGEKENTVICVFVKWKRSISPVLTREKR